jgi:endonuclease YncB( thermonuclease family)
MMRAVRAIAFCAALAATNPCHAQMSPPSVPPPKSAPSTIYTPRETVQRTPMRVSVVDGRSFRDVGTGATYRLYGIETCEPGQFAELGPQLWPCHVVPVAWLVAATLNKWVACNIVAEKDGIRHARCASNEFPDMGLELLRIGAAVIDVAESGPLIDLYRNAEAEAKRSARGLWGSTFEMPWAFRQRQASQPQVSQPQPLPPQ